MAVLKDFSFVLICFRASLTVPKFYGSGQTDLKPIFEFEKTKEILFVK